MQPCHLKPIYENNMFFTLENCQKKKSEIQICSECSVKSFSIIKTDIIE